jgi:hypothetical protein
VNQENAQNAINSAALVTAGIYFYRKLIEPATAPGASANAGRPGAGSPVDLTGATEQFFGKGEAPPASRFIVGWGFTFLTLSLVVGMSPELAGYFAILIAVGSLLGNGAQVFEDVGTQLKGTALPGVAGADAATPTVNVSYAGHTPTPSLPTGQGRKTPQKKKGSPRTATHPRTTLS